LEQKKGDLELIRAKNMKILDNFIRHGRANPPDSFLLLVQAAYFSFDLKPMISCGTFY